MTEIQESQKDSAISNLEIRMGIGLVLCLFITGFFPQIQRLAACTGVLMCTQGEGKFTWKSGLTRLEGVLCGGGIAVIVVLLDNVIGIGSIFYLMSGVGIVLNLFICEMLHMPKVAGRVSGITFILVAFLAQGNGRILYAVNRLIGTLVGAVVALLLSALWDQYKKKVKTVIAQKETGSAA